ncbi:MAG: carboxypeptidase-like regulatory domain-containing protein, partial [Candidatus Thermoplasmatota archaeon]|nr:carboxypeptidase-like regulatory domain-containing protein [Candidatus Thermoplasmatota archaeon]
EAEWTAYTGIDGTYTIKNIVNATYTVTASKPGNGTGNKTGIIVRPLETTTVADITMSVGAPEYSQDFSGTFPPVGWAKYTGNPATEWVQSDTNNAGGTAPEAMFKWADAVSTWRLYAGPFDTTGMTSVTLKWANFNDDYGSGVDCRIQTSTDTVTWTNTTWVWSSGSGDRGPGVETLSITENVGSSTFYFSFSVIGDSYQLDDWWVDDVWINAELKADNPPVLSGGSVVPEAASEGSSFTFYVNYTDCENVAPSYIKITIDEKSTYDMVGVDAGDTTYHDGKQYKYTTTITGQGKHKFKFSASDGISEAGGETWNFTFEVYDTVAPALEHTQRVFSKDAGQRIYINATATDNTAESVKEIKLWWKFETGAYEPRDMIDTDNQIGPGDFGAVIPAQTSSGWVYYYVTAYDGTQTTTYWNVTVGTPFRIRIIGIIIGASPARVTATRSGNNIVLNWTDTGATYNIYRSTSVDGTGFNWDNPVATGVTGSSWTDTGKYTDSGNYSWVVNATGNATKSNIAFKRCQPILIPKAPNINWIAIPHYTPYAKLKDIAGDVNAQGPDSMPDGDVGVVRYWNVTLQQYRETVYDDTEERWVGTGADDLVTPGMAVMLSAKTSFIWKVVGAHNKTLKISISIPKAPNINWVSLPYHTTYVKLKDVALDVNAQGPDSMPDGDVGVVRYWNVTLQQYRETV